MSPAADTVAWAAPALEVAFEQLGSPAFILGRGGAVVHANAAGREALARDGDGLRAQLTDRDLGRRAGLRFIELGGGHLCLCIGDRRSREELTALADAWADRLSLSGRERRALQALARGAANKEIALELGLSLRSAELLVARLVERLGVRTRGALVARLWNAA